MGRLYNEVVTTKPTIRSNVEEVQYRNFKFVMWDNANRVLGIGMEFV